MDANKSLDDDNDVDFNDLRIFCKDWLWTPDRLSEFEDGGEEEMMQEGTEQEFESQQSMLAGEEQTPAIYLISDVNEPNSGDEVTVQVYSDASIFCMGAGITITGDANITGALSTADCNEYGWDPGWLTDPYIEDNWVYIEGVNWNGSDLVGTSGVVGYIKFRYNSGQVSVAITDDYGETFDINCAPVLLSGQALVFGPADSNEQ